MAYIAIFPKSAEAQQRLADHNASVMNILSQATKDVLNVPDHDIIVEMNQCTAMAFNPLAVSRGAVPDVVIKIATSDRDLQPRFQTLCDEIVSRWDMHIGNGFKLELWINAIDTWGCYIDCDQSLLLTGLGGGRGGSR
jgi:hypothetical protein